MGSGAPSKLVATELDQASDSELQAALASLSAEDMQKLREALKVVAGADPPSSSRTRADMSEELERYLKPHGLQPCMQSGAVRFLRGSYLVKLCERGASIQRRQALPEEAFWGTDEALLNASMAEDVEMSYSIRGNGITIKMPRGQLFLHALSYPWCSKGHPDPNNHHLNTLGKAIALRIEFVAKADLTDIALFWDFASLFQNPRETEQEQQLFKEGLGAANLIYGHTCVTTWMLTSVPIETVPYMKRGWCRFERAISSINKNPVLLLDLGLVGDWSSLDTYKAMHDLCHAKDQSRPPPVTPELLSLELDSAPFTNGKTEQELVQKLYDKTFSVMAATTKEVNVACMSWEIENAVTLAHALPHFISCKYVNLWGNKFGPGAVDHLAPALSNMKVLTYLWIDIKNFGAGTTSFLQQLPPRLQSLAIFFYDEAAVDALLDGVIASHALPELCLAHGKAPKQKMDELKKTWATHKDVSNLTWAPVQPDTMHF